LTHLPKTKVERKRSLAEGQWAGQGRYDLHHAYHVPAKGGQMAVLIKCAKFLKNRESLVHSRNFRWVNGTAQEILKKRCQKKR
jgi:hypothetical protein